MAVSKGFHPRFAVFADGSLTELVSPLDPETRMDPIRAVAGGMTVGVTRSVLVTVRVEHARAGAAFERQTLVAPGQDDLRVIVAGTEYRRGRPLRGLVLSVGGLGTFNRVVAVDYRFTLASGGGERPAPRVPRLPPL